MKEVDEFNILVSGDYYRVNSIQRFEDGSVKNLDISEGLAVEEKIDDDHYIVINYIRPKDDEPAIENVGLRPMNTLNLRNNETIPDYFERIQEYYNCLGFVVTTLTEVKN